MKTKIAANQTKTYSLLISSSNIVRDIGIEILKLTGYFKEEILNKEVREVFIKLFRLRPEILDQIETKGCMDCYIFTKSLEAVEVSLSFLVGKDTAEKIYTLMENPNSRLSGKLSFVEQTFDDNIVACAIYSMPDLILLKLNQKYLDFIDIPFNESEKSIGKTIGEIISGFNGTSAEVIWKAFMENPKSVYKKEYECDRLSSGVTYWDATLTPVFEKSKLKYLYHTSTEVTERVQAGKLQSQAIQYENTLLESIIENMTEAFAVYDPNGKLMLKNAEARKLYSHPELLETLGNEHNSFEYYDLEGNRLLQKDLPTYKALKGEKVKNQIIVIKRKDNDQFTEVNATPIFDKDNNLVSVASFHRDITDSFQHRILVEKHQELTLQSEYEKSAALKREIDMKDEFISMISHELRTPLTVITSAIQAIEVICKNELSEKLNGFLIKIKQNSYRQIRLVNNLLEHTRLSLGYVKINKVNQDIIFLTKSIIESVYLYAQEKEVKLIFTSTFGEKIIGLDEEKYERIILNLLSNAIKFTPKGKSITVKISASKGSILIDVIDKGIGIPKEKLKMIFERFGQVDSSLSRQAEGSGIGLSLVRNFIEAMGGTISVKSKVGQGSTFSVLLPASKVPENAEETMLQELTEKRLIQATAIEFSDIYLK